MQTIVMHLARKSLGDKQSYKHSGALLSLIWRSAPAYLFEQESMVFHAVSPDVFWARTEMMRDLHVYPTAWICDNMPLLDEELGDFIVNANRSPWSATRVACTLRMGSYLTHFLNGTDPEWIAAFLDHLCNFSPSFMSLNKFEMIVGNSKCPKPPSKRLDRLYLCVVARWRISLCNSKNPAGLKSLASLGSPILQVARIICEAASMTRDEQGPRKRLRVQ
jgi:hypothetical protein